MPCWPHFFFTVAVTYFTEMPLRQFEPAFCLHCSLVRMSFATKQTCASSPSLVRRFSTPSKELRSKLVLQIQHWAAPSSWSLISYRMLITDTQTCTPRWVIKATTSVRHDALFQKSSHLEPLLLSQSSELGGRLSGLLERYQQYQDEVVSLHSWLSTQEQNQSIAKPSGETDPQNLQNTLRQVQVQKKQKTNIDISNFSVF